jgi:Domain of unknown function (DUF1905)
LEDHGSRSNLTGQSRFEATVFYWRGPSPFFFAPIPAQLAAEVKQIAKHVTYGWGMIPVEAAINGGVMFRTSLFPKDGTYLLPVKAAVRRRSQVTAGDLIEVEMTVQPSER